MTYFVKYTVSYSANTCPGSLNDGKDVIFALANKAGDIIPASKHVAAISDEVYTNNISLGVIVSPKTDEIIRLKNLTEDLREVKIHAATVTIFRIA